MARYSLRIKKSARKELQSIDRKSDRIRIVRKIQSLADDPRPPGALKLSGLDRNRIRQARFRILYSIEDAGLVIYVIRIADRRDI